MTDITQLAQQALELAEKATPPEYWERLTVGQEYGSWYRHFAEGPATTREQAVTDAQFIAFARNHIQELAQAVLDLHVERDAAMASVLAENVKLLKVAEGARILAKEVLSDYAAYGEAVDVNNALADLDTK